MNPTICQRELAERKGFEPLDLVKGQRFSRPPRSTTPAPLRDGLRILRRSPLFGKEAPEHVATAFCLETPTACQRWPQARVGGEIEHRSASAGTVVVCSPDHELEPGLTARGCTHWTGLEGDIEGAVRESPVADCTTRRAKGDEFGVGRRIIVLLSSVAGAGNDLAAARHHCTDRNLAAGCRSFGLGYGLGHEAPIVVVEDPFRQHLTRITKGPRKRGPHKTSLRWIT